MDDVCGLMTKLQSVIISILHHYDTCAFVRRGSSIWTSERASFWSTQPTKMRSEEVCLENTGDFNPQQ
jgi:hypothetical protein